MAVTVTGVVVAAVGAAYVFLVVDKLGVLGRLRKRRRARQRRANVKLH